MLTRNTNEPGVSCAPWQIVGRLLLIRLALQVAAERDDQWPPTHVPHAAPSLVKKNKKTDKHGKNWLGASMSLRLFALAAVDDTHDAARGFNFPSN